MLSRRTRLITRLTGLAFVGLGAILFVAPAWAAERFPWGVTPFVAMTIGGWCLGTAAAAWIGGGGRAFGDSLPVLVYLWAFGAAELAVLVVFRGTLHRDVLLAPVYVGALGGALLSAASGLIDLLRLRAAGEPIESEGAAVVTPTPIRVALLALTLFLAALTVGGSLAGAIGASTSGKVFPQPLTLFTVRAFAAFYASLCLATLAVVVRPTRAAAVRLGIVGVALIVPIVGAALANLKEFDLANRPFGLLYLGAYLVVLVPSIPFVWRNRALVS